MVFTLLSTVHVAEGITVFNGGAAGCYLLYYQCCLDVNSGEWEENGVDRALVE